MTIYMWYASVAWFVMLLGVLNRKNRKIHVPCMLTTIFMDLSLVLFLQITRSAVQTAMGFDLPILQYFHIGFSTLATILYFPMLYTGFKLLRNQKTALLYRLHIKIGVACFLSRTLGFCFMFSMLK
jgi:hypothetical protein